MPTSIVVSDTLRHGLAASDSRMLVHLIFTTEWGPGLVEALALLEAGDYDQARSDLARLARLIVTDWPTWRRKMPTLAADLAACVQAMTQDPIKSYIAVSALTQGVMDALPAR